MEWKVVFIEDDMSWYENTSMRIETFVAYVGIVIA